jgi:hypothetical protein
MKKAGDGAAQGDPANPNANDPNQPNGAPGGPNTSGASQSFMYGGSGNIDNTFGGGSLGYYSYPMGSSGSMFVNLFRHPHGNKWHHGGKSYPFHAFDRHPFFNWGGLFGSHGHHDDDHRFHDFDHGGRGNSWGSDPYQYPRGGAGGGGWSSRWRDNNASSPGNHVM